VVLWKFVVEHTIPITLDNLHEWYEMVYYLNRMELNIYITEASNNYHVKRHKSLYILFIKKRCNLRSDH
jgi:hypothetical protein